MALAVWIYPGSDPGEQRGGTESDFQQARDSFIAAWCIFAAKRTEADYQVWRDQRDFTAEILDAGARGEISVTGRRAMKYAAERPFADFGNGRGRLEPLRRAAAYRLLAAFLILKSSIRLPERNCATSQRGCLPRPAQTLKADQDSGIWGTGG